jgi:cytoplasmic iron level regulating protein YaaA (DUF328/UPF0246 family)
VRADKVSRLKLSEIKFENTFKDNARPAIYTFDGDVYTGLDAYTIP